ncbi:MAG: YraN family protein [Anaerolineales bacterium]
MPTPRQELAQWGESLAERYLRQKGYTLIAKNARTPHGELDLVTQQGSVIVFVEVKTRSSTAYGLPEEAITATKQAHLIASALAFLQAHPTLSGDWRIDVIAIRRPKNVPPEIVHFENAIGA